MPSIRDNDLRKSPEYCHYLEAVKDGELTLPDFKIDDNGVPDIHPYEVYCRVKGCLKRTVPSANRNILVKHLKDKNSHGMEFTLHNGPPTMKELMEAKAWYEGLFEGTVLPTPTPTKKRKRPATKSKDHNTKGVENSNEGEAGNDQDNGEGPSSAPYAVHTPVTGRNLSKPVLPRDEKGKPLFMQIRREGSKAAKSAGEKGTIPCKTCRNAKGKAPCGSKPYCEFWRFFSSIDEAKGASMQPQGSVVDLEALESSSNNPETNMDNAKETSNEESVSNKENKHENEEEKAAEPEEVQGDGGHVSEHLAITPFAQLNSGEDNSIATNLDLRDFGLNLESI